MTITSAPQRSDHPARHRHVMPIVALIAALGLAMIGVALLVHGGGSSSPGVP